MEENFSNCSEEIFVIGEDKKKGAKAKVKLRGDIGKTLWFITGT